MATPQVPALLHKMSVSSQKAWYKKNKMELPAHLKPVSAAQAKKQVRIDTKELERKSLKAYGATKGTKVGEVGGEKAADDRDTIKPLSPEQHAKVQAAIKAAKGVVKTKRAPIKSKEDRLAFIKAAVAKAKSPKRAERFDVATLDNNDEHDNIRRDNDLMHSVGVRHSYNEEVETKEETETSAGGQEMSLAQKLAQKAMKMKKETPGADVPADKQIAQQMGEEADKEGDAREYDYEGEMAKTQLKGILKHAQNLHDSLEDDTNLPEWVQSKITLAHDYIQTASDYMDAQDDEDLDEEVQNIDEKYMGFKALKASIAAKGGARDPGAVAAAIGRKKYGKAAFQKAAAKGEKMEEALDPVGQEDDDIDNDGKKNTKSDKYLKDRREKIRAAINKKLGK